MLLLEIQPLPGSPFEVPLTGEEVHLGRATCCEIRIPSRFTSRRHARIFRRDGHYLLEDLDSRNGTLLNDQPVTEPTPIQAGDRVRLSGALVVVSQLATPSEILSSASHPVLSSSSGISPSGAAL